MSEIPVLGRKPPVPSPAQLREMAAGLRQVRFLVLAEVPGTPRSAPAEARGLGENLAGIVDALADAQERIARLEAAAKEKG